MTLQWLLTDALTGTVLDDPPGLTADYPLRRTIGQYETGTAHLNLDHAAPGWERATLPGAAVTACYDDTDTNRAIQWAGLITKRTRNYTDVVDLSLITMEGYPDRRYVGTKTYAAADQNVIVADLIARFVADPGGIPIAVATIVGGPAPVRDRTYKLGDYIKVYQRLQELMAVSGGPEWVIEWAWNATGTGIVPTLTVGNRIGAAPRPGLVPAATFDLPGCLTDFQVVEDYTDGKGANRVTAYSSGSGTVPTSGPVNAAITGDRPTYEFAWQPSSSITDPATLTAYATKAVAQLAPGAVAVTLTAALANPGTPRYGTDWRLGDDITYQIGGLDDQGNETVKSFPGGITGVGRCIAYEVTLDTISPILAQSSLYTAPTG